jgi:hypothetical protein
MVAVSLPRRLICFVGLIAPSGPALARTSSEQLKKRRGTAGLDDVILLIGLRECSRLRVASRFTCRRPAASVRAFLPRTPNKINSVTLRK